MSLGDPKACRERAAMCARRAATCNSPEAREKFASLAKTWLHLAIQLEEQWALLEEYGDYREAGREKKQA
jgi:hypothetical protein